MIFALLGRLKPLVPCASHPVRNIRFGNLDSDIAPRPPAPRMPTPAPRPQAEEEASRTAVFRSIRDGDTEQLLKTLQELGDVDFQNAQGQTPMQALLLTQGLPVWTGCRMMYHLLDQGADPNTVVNRPGSTVGVTPLSWLIDRFAQDPAVVYAQTKRLLDAGAGAEVKLSPSTASHPVLRFLEFGAHNSTTAQATGMLRLLLRDKPDLQVLQEGHALEKAAWGYLPPSGNTVRTDWIQALQLLIDYGLDPAADHWRILEIPVKSNLPQTYQFLRRQIPAAEAPELLCHLLRVAMECKRPDMMRLILAEPVDFKASPFATPQMLLEQHMMQDRPDLEIVRVLVENGADPSLESKHGKGFSVLHEACQGLEGSPNGRGYRNLEWPEGVEVLLQAPGITLDRHGYNGATPLMVACSKGFVGVTRLLLEAGADPTLKSAQNMSAMDYVNNRPQMEPNKKRMILRLLSDALNAQGQASPPKNNEAPD